VEAGSDCPFAIKGKTSFVGNYRPIHKGKGVPVLN
jgi:hypothetical protein